MKPILMLTVTLLALGLMGGPAFPCEAPSPEVSTASNPSLASLTEISVQTAEDGNGSVIAVSTSEATSYKVLRLSHPRRLVLDLEGAKNATKRWKYAADAPGLMRIRLGRFSERHGGVVRVVADLDGNPTTKVLQVPTGFRIELKLDEAEGAAETSIPPPGAAPTPQPQPAPAAALPEAAQAAKAAGTVAAKAQRNPNASSGQKSGSAKTPKAGPKYTGELISLNLKDVDLKDFFRLIHEISGLNIIVDPNVSGKLTLVLDDVPWDQALDIVLKNYGLGDQLNGNVLRIARISTLVHEQQEQQKLSEAKEDTAPLVTVFRPVNYAKAATIAALLKTWAGGGALSRRGTVLVDERTNTLIISDIQSQIPGIESVIGKLDRKAQQVSIEARIIRATSDFARNLSTALSFAQRNPSGSLVTGGATGTGVSGQPLSPPTVTTTSATGFGVFVISNLGANYAINAAIAAAETRDKAKTISRPSIVTQNNVQGTVVQGTQIPIQTTINNTISIQYVQASLQLQVTPQVTEDRHVFLLINIQNSSPGPALTLAGPTINTQSATTQVLVPDGGTVVFGGVTVTTRSQSSTGVPLLGSIPILGHLFKSSVVENNDQELLFFVTPKVLPT